MESVRKALEGSSGTHVYYLPTAKTGSFSVAAPLIISGPGVERGLELKKPVNMTDVVPTAAKLLNVLPPKDNEGRVLTEILS